MLTRPRWLLTSLIAFATTVSTAFGSACSHETERANLVDVVSSIETALPPVPEVAATADARTVLEALERPARADPELYRAASRVYGEPVSPDADPAALASWAIRAAAGVRAYGVFVEDDRGRLVASGAYWISPLVTRLHIVRVDGARIGTRVPDDALLDAVGSCLVPVRNWVRIPTGVLVDLLAASGGVQAYIVADGTSRGATRRRWVEGGDLLDAAAFSHPATADLPAFSLWFVGSGPGPVALARALPRVRSNLGPRALWGLVQDLR